MSYGDPKLCTPECNPSVVVNQMYLDEEADRKRKMYIKVCSYLDAEFSNWRERCDLVWRVSHQGVWNWSIDHHGGGPDDTHEVHRR